MRFILLALLLLLSVEKQTNGQEMRMHIGATNELCVVRKAPFSSYSLILYLGQEERIPSLEECIAYCKISAVASICTAVAYRNDTSKCMLLKYGIRDPDIKNISQEFPDYYHIQRCQTAVPQGQNGYKAIIPLVVLELTCEVEIFAGDTSVAGYGEVSTYYDVPSFQQCLTICTVWKDVTQCVGGHYSFSRQSCKLIAPNPSHKGYVVRGDETFGRITNCVRTPNEEPQRTMSSIELPILQQTCEIEMFQEGKARGIRSIGGRDRVQTLQHCLTLCRVQGTHCQGVHYSYWAQRCTIVVREQHGRGLYEVKRNEVLVLIKECRENRPALPNVPTRAPQGGQRPAAPENEEEAEVDVTTEYLLQSREFCKIRNRKNETTVKGYEQLLTLSETSSLESCLFYCRMGGTNVPCAAVAYRKSSRSCVTYRRRRTGEVAVPKKADFVEIIGCQKARPVHVPIVGLKYYLPTLEEVCKVEGHKTDAVFGWKPLSGAAAKVGSQEECLEVCRIREGEGCTAVLLSKEKKCVPMLHTTSLARFDLNSTVFLQIMQCRSGTMVEILT